MSKIAFPTVVLMLALGASPAPAQSASKVGGLSCDVSAGIGMIVTQKQTVRCEFKPSDGGPSEFYTGKIEAFGVALGAVKEGRLGWAVVAPAAGVPHGALAGVYGGVGAQATVAAGVGANVLVGGTGRAFSLQPLTVQGQTGLNVAGGITTLTLVSEP